MSVEKSGFGYWKLFKYCFSWLKTPEGRTQFTKLFIALCFAAILLFLSAIAIFAGVSLWKILLALFVIGGLAYVIAIFYLDGWITLKVLQTHGTGRKVFSLKTLWGFFEVSIRAMLYAFLSLKKPAFLLLAIAGGGLLVISGAGYATFELGIILLALYGLVVVYNFARLLISSFIFLAGETKSPQQSIEESFKLTEGKTKEAVIALALVLGLMFGAAILIETFFGIALFVAVEEVSIKEAMQTQSVGIVEGLVFAAVTGAISKAAYLIIGSYGGVYAYFWFAGKPINKKRKGGGYKK